jgi:hypothetical protein
MDAVPESLLLDLLEWVARGHRSYEEVMDAWRTSCPRLPVWEEANDRGLVARDEVKGVCRIRITRAGLALLDRQRPSPKSAEITPPQSAQADSRSSKSPAS